MVGAWRRRQEGWQVEVGVWAGVGALEQIDQKVYLRRGCLSGNQCSYVEIWSEGKCKGPGVAASFVWPSQGTTGCTLLRVHPESRTPLGALGRGSANLCLSPRSRVEAEGR